MNKLPLVLVLCAIASSTYADFILDDFSEPATPPAQTTGTLELTSGIDPSITSIDRTVSGVTIGGGTAAPFSLAGGVVSIAYDNPIPGGPLTLDANFLVLEDFSFTVAGDGFDVVATFGSGAADPTNSATRAIAPGESGDIYIDITGITEVGDVDAITVSFAGANSTTSIGDFAGFSFVSVPEPTSLALVAFGVGGFGLRRRRRRG